MMILLKEESESIISNSDPFAFSDIFLNISAILSLKKNLFFFEEDQVQY